MLIGDSTYGGSAVECTDTEGGKQGVLLVRGVISGAKQAHSAGGRSGFAQAGPAGGSREERGVRVRGHQWADLG